MREKNYNTGLRGVLFEARHYARMGSAIWLYGWLVLRQTHQTGTTGWVLGGAPITYREIECETGFNQRTLERWMSSLRRHGYIVTETAPGGVIVRILKAKKHLLPAHGGNPLESARKVAEGVRKVAERGPQTCVANHAQNPANARVAEGIGSSSVVRIKEEEQNEIHRGVENRAHLANAEVIQDCEQQEFRRQFRNALQQHDLKTSWPDKTKNILPNQDSRQSWNQSQTPRPIENQNQGPAAIQAARPSTQQTFPWQLRERMRLLRAERDEGVRRELAVGTGPEARRP
ncbi:MAG: hypothetical protein WA192_02360 [Candidatus Acidiferrales bacterium]